MKKVILVDGSGLVYRAYFAFLTRPLTTTRGENTSALFGFLRFFTQIVRDMAPDRVIVAFDKSRVTFRNEIYSDYKANREATPPDLKAQIPWVIEALTLMDVPVLEMDNYEADDIIGTLSERLKSNNDVLIISGDKDLLQLVGGNVRALRPQKGLTETKLLDREGVKAEMGVYPEQTVDYLAILGDTSDNIPGIKGIGEKGAVALLEKYATLDGIYAHEAELTPGNRKKLSESRDNAYLSRTLAAIRTDLDIDPEKTVRPIDRSRLANDKVREFLRHYQLASVIQDLAKLTDTRPKDTPGSLFGGEEPEIIPELSPITGRYTALLTKKDVKDCLDAVIKAGQVSIDTETTTNVPFDSELIGVSLSLAEKEGVFLPAAYPAGQDYDTRWLLETLRPMLESPDVKKTGQNIKYEAEVFARRGIRLCGMAFDTMLAAYLLNPVRARHNLESLLSEYLRLSKTDYKTTLKEAGAVKKESTLLDVPFETLVKYAAGDSDAALRLSKVLKPLVEREGLDNVLYNIEMPLVEVLAAMESAGVLIDTGMLKDYSLELSAQILQAEKRIYALAGHEFNIQSPAQLGKVLFEELGLDPVKKTEGGKPSTDEEVLQALSYSHELPQAILHFRSLSKLLNTYVNALPGMVNASTGRVHTSFNQTIAATGRLSSTDPNLQNIPVRDEAGIRIREAFTAAPGKTLLSADYSQIELRVLAHFADETAMKKAFSEGLDIHAHTASLLWNKPIAEVADAERRRAKSVNFGIIYGLQAFGLSRQLGIPMAEAKDFIDHYFKSFPGVRGFIEKTLSGVAETGLVRTWSGRLRRFPDLIGREVKSVAHMNPSQRMAVNTVIQGSAADIIKLAMIKAHSALAASGLDARLILQIHDELVVECAESEAMDVKRLITECMESAVELTVPLTVDAGIGRNWRLAKA